MTCGWMMVAKGSAHDLYARGMCQFQVLWPEMEARMSMWPSGVRLLDLCCDFIVRSFFNGALGEVPRVSP